MMALMLAGEILLAYVKWPENVEKYVRKISRILSHLARAQEA